MPTPEFTPPHSAGPALTWYGLEVRIIVRMLPWSAALLLAAGLCFTFVPAFALVFGIDHAENGRTPSQPW